MRGKPLNTLAAIEEKNYRKISGNKVIESVVNVVGMNLGLKEQKNINFENIVIATDSDVDGYHIFALIFAFIHEFGLNIIEEGKLFRLVTPLFVIKRKGKIEKLLYTLGEYNTFIKNNDMKGFDYKYYKGLGSWKQNDLETVVEFEGGIEKMIQKIEYDKDAKETFYSWMSKLESNVDKRKDALKLRAFDINSL